MATQPTVRRLYPLRYWMLVAVSVGVPKFLLFDARGKNHEFGLLNPWSLSQIALVLFCTLLLLAITLGGGRSIFQRKFRFHSWCWLSLIAILLVASIASPKDNMALSLYRMFEWLILYYLLASAYTRTPLWETSDFLRNAMLMTAKISIAVVLITLVIYPPLAIMAENEFRTAEVEHRLGGTLVQPNLLGLLANIGILHSLLYTKGTKRMGLIAFYGAVLLGTVSRTSWASIALAIAVYLLLAPIKVVFKLLGFISIGVSIVLLTMFSDTVLHIVERGQGMNGLQTLSDRTEVWATALRAFHLRPMLGYGYIDGVKEILGQLFTNNYWTPPHCHNEYLQALVSGGIFCGVLVALLYLMVTYRLVRLRLSSPRDVDVLFFGLVFMQLLISSMVSPLLTTNLQQKGAIFFMCFIACFDALPMLRAMKTSADMGELVTSAAGS